MFVLTTHLSLRLHYMPKKRMFAPNLYLNSILIQLYSIPHTLGSTSAVRTASSTVPSTDTHRCALGSELGSRFTVRIGLMVHFR